MKKLFQIEVGEDEKSGIYLANVFSVTEGKGKSIEGASLKIVMSEVAKAVRKKVHQLHKFPLPEPSRIINPNGNGAPNLIVVGRN